MRRREFMAGLGGAAAWPLAARAQQRGQQPALPVVGFVNGGSADAFADYDYAAAFRKGLGETGYIEGRNVTVEYHWLEGRYESLPALMADLVRRRVAVIATPGFESGSIAAKAATATIPIVFGAGDDPVKLGLVASLARPGGNLTGVNYFTAEVLGKRLDLLKQLLPKAVRVAVLSNPNRAFAEAHLGDLQEAARILGLQIQVLNASTIAEIDAAFAALARERPDALFVMPDGFFGGRRVQLVNLASDHSVPAAYPNRDFVEAGGLMSYGADITESFHVMGEYIGRILKGAKPADLPVQQARRFVFAVNLGTARLLGLEIPPPLLAITDVAIE